MNVWIVSLNDKRKHCHNCEAVITDQNKHISVGEYCWGKYRKAFTVCGECMVQELDRVMGVERIASGTLGKPYTIRVRSGHSRPWFVGSDTRKEA